MITSKEINRDIDSQEFFIALRYSINLMWINKHKDDRSEYICSGNKAGQTINFILNLLKEWRTANPEAEVNFWYDSQCTNIKAIENTQALLEEICDEAHASIKMRDIREIPFVKNNSDQFLPSIPIYFRVDFLKLILCAHVMESEKLSSVIFTDFRISPRTKEELYNPTVLKNLEQFGMQFNGVENQFLQMMSTPELLESLKHAINSSLLIATNQLNLALQKNKSAYLQNLYYAPFDATLARIHIYYLAIQSKNPIKIRGDVVKEGGKNHWVNYEPEKHGYIMFGNRLLLSNNGSYYYNSELHEDIQIRHMVMLPESMKFPDGIKITAGHFDPFVPSLDMGSIGSSHPWHGELPVPMQGDEFRCSFWPLNTNTPNLISDVATTERENESISPEVIRNDSQKHKETVLNRKSEASTSETLKEDTQDKIKMKGPHS